jgi:hypothetical protein
MDLNEINRQIRRDTYDPRVESLIAWNNRNAPMPMERRNAMRRRNANPNIPFLRMGRPFWSLNI